MLPPRSSPRLCGWLHRVVLIGASSLPDGVGGDDRCGVAVGEPFERRGVTERPIDPFDTMQPGELNGFGHLHLHPRRACRGSLDEPHSCAGTELQELRLGSVARLGLTGQRTRWSWRVVSVIDARVPRCRPGMACDLDRTRCRDVCGDDLIAIDTDPHDLIGEGVRNRIRHTTETDRRCPRHLAGLTERCGERRVRQTMQACLFLGEHHRRRPTCDPVLASVDLDHEPGARLDEFRPRRVCVEQVGVGRDQVRFRDLDGALDPALGFRVRRHARRHGDPVVVADLNDQRMPHSDPCDVAGGHCLFVVRQPIRRHPAEGAHRPVQTGDHRRQRLVPHREHHPEPAPRQPRAEQIRLPTRDLRPMTPVPLRPHPRLHNPWAIDAPAAHLPVQLHDRQRPADGAIGPLEPEPDELVEHDIATHTPVGSFDPFLDLGHEPIDQLRSLRRRHTVGQQALVAHRDPMLDRVMRATREFARGPITVRQRERFQDFHDLLVRLQQVPSGRLALSGDTSRTGRNTTSADARSSKDFQRGQNH